MPFGDGTGPRGIGPMTGRGTGYCAGSGQPGFTNPTLNRRWFDFGWRRACRYPYAHQLAVPNLGYDCTYYSRGYPNYNYPYVYL